MGLRGAYVVPNRGLHNFRPWSNLAILNLIIQVLLYKISIVSHKCGEKRKICSKKKDKRNFHKASKRPVLLGIEHWCRLSIDMHYLYICMYLHSCKEAMGALNTYIIKSKFTPHKKLNPYLYTYLCTYYLFLSKYPSTCATSSPFFLLNTLNPLV